MTTSGTMNAVSSSSGMEMPSMPTMYRLLMTSIHDLSTTNWSFVPESKSK